MHRQMEVCRSHHLAGKDDRLSRLLASFRSPDRSRAACLDPDIEGGAGKSTR
jgi:hypothetical protein